MFFGRHEPNQIFAVEFEHGLIPRDDQLQLGVVLCDEVDERLDVPGLVLRKGCEVVGDAVIFGHTLSVANPDSIHNNDRTPALLQWCTCMLA